MSQGHPQTTNNLSEVEKLHKQVDIVFNPTFDPSLNLITEIDDGWEKMPFISKQKKSWWQKFIGFFSFNWFFSPLS